MQLERRLDDQECKQRLRLRLRLVVIGLGWVVIECAAYVIFCEIALCGGGSYSLIVHLRTIATTQSKGVDGDIVCIVHA